MRTVRRDNLFLSRYEICDSSWLDDLFEKKGFCQINVDNCPLFASHGAEISLIYKKEKDGYCLLPYCFYDYHIIPIDDLVSFLEAEAKGCFIEATKTQIEEGSPHFDGNMWLPADYEVEEIYERVPLNWFIEDYASLVQEAYEAELKRGNEGRASRVGENLSQLLSTEGIAFPDKKMVGLER